MKRPYHWYKALVLAGARYHGLPEAYLAAIEAIGAVEDPDPERRRQNEQLLLACGGGVVGDTTGK